MSATNFAKVKELRMSFIHWTDKLPEELFLHPKEDFLHHQPIDNKGQVLLIQVINLQTDTVTSTRKLVQRVELALEETLMDQEPVQILEKVISER